MASGGTASRRKSEGGAFTETHPGVAIAVAVGVFPGGDELASAGVEVRGIGVGALTQAQSTRPDTVIAQQIQETRPIAFSRGRFKIAQLRPRRFAERVSFGKLARYCKLLRGPTCHREPPRSYLNGIEFGLVFRVASAEVGARTGKARSASDCACYAEYARLQYTCKSPACHSMNSGTVIRKKDRFADGRVPHWAYTEFFRLDAFWGTAPFGGLNQAAFRSLFIL
jgi:hypothetical protein